MSNILEFKRPPKNNGYGNTLCNEGHHKWTIIQDKQFDTQSGKLVTLFECARCKKKKNSIVIANFMNLTTQIKISIQTEDFDINQENKSLRDGSTNVGAIIDFIGIVRSGKQTNNPLKAIYLEHYSPMTEQSIQRIIELACLRWDIIAITVIHRIGYLNIGENILYVGVASEHRKKRFGMCGFHLGFFKK